VGWFFERQGALGIEPDSEIYITVTVAQKGS